MPQMPLSVPKTSLSSSVLITVTLRFLMVPKFFSMSVPLRLYIVWLLPFITPPLSKEPQAASLSVSYAMSSLFASISFISR